MRGNFQKLNCQIEVPMMALKSLLNFKPKFWNQPFSHLLAYMKPFLYVKIMQDFMGSRIETSAGKLTDLIVFCNGGSKETDNTKSEGTKVEPKVLY